MKTYLLNTLTTLIIAITACFIIRRPALENKTSNNNDILAKEFANFFNIKSYKIIIPKEYTDGYRINFFLKVNDKIIPLGEDFSLGYGSCKTPKEHKLIFSHKGFSEIRIGNVNNVLDLNQYIPDYNSGKHLSEFKDNIVQPKECFIRYYKHSIFSSDFGKDIAGIFFEISKL